MRAFKLILKSVFAIAGLLVMGLVLLPAIFGWASSNTAKANGECSMLIIEKKIEPANTATEYRRACMASRGYGMQPQCYVDNFTVAACFTPRWMFWVNKI
ncbi:hypothetical protein ASD02_00645 [Ensifer sp. Root1252]|nr:hypothetical protein ASD02_00645 [Ensifer sp. Root1252]KRC83495.1 hypothetical protein ASE32_00640 [Ensifer sp. Root231]KRC86599.1 hypothetical protein ASE47_17010 [Ensifer sp. Root258]